MTPLTGTQFTLRKEIYSRVNKAFVENGLEFACREVRVAIPNLDQGHKLTDDEKPPLQPPPRKPLTRCLMPHLRPANSATACASAGITGHAKGR